MQNYIEILQSSPDAQRGTGRENLLTKTTGTYYTPEIVGRRLVRAVLEAAPPPVEGPVSAIDPFCGDGRLIVWLLEEAQLTPDWAGRSWRVALWDCDHESLSAAEQNVTSSARRLNLECLIERRHGDTFELFVQQYGVPGQLNIQGAPMEQQDYDLVVTNPPWEVVKPDTRDLLPLDEGTREKYISALRMFSQRLTEHFPTSMPKTRFAGWGVNLARVGVEVAVRLGRAGGAVGIVSPASVCADQASEMLRRWLLTEHGMKQIAHYPAEAFLFQGVDQPHVDLIVIPHMPEETAHIEVVQFDTAGEEINRRLLRSPRATLEANRFVLQVLATAQQINVMERMVILPQLKELQGSQSGQLWTGRELDESGHTALLTDDETSPVFFKGRMLNRLEPPVTSSRIWVSPTSFPSCQFPRLVWRDVSRPTQKRRVQATLIPAGWMTGNSLGVAHFREHDQRRLLGLLGVFSSLPFEFQVRSILTTNHVSVGAIREVRVPPLSDEFLDLLAPIMRRRLQGEAAAEVEMEVVVAQAYGLNQDELQTVMDALPKLTYEERQTILTSPHWRLP